MGMNLKCVSDSSRGPSCAVDDLPTAEKVEQPDPNGGRGQQNLARGGHEKQPRRAHQSKELDGRGRGSNVEGKEGEKEENGILNVGLFKVVLLQIAQAVPSVERGVEAGNVVDALVPGVGLCARTAAAVVALGEAVEKGQVDVFGEEGGKLGLAREGAWMIGHGCARR